jgi:CNT family concentrative nucleoside transporter
MTELSEHTRAILSFALCGFANLFSIAVLLGGLGALVPSLSNLMSTAISGLFLFLFYISTNLTFNH